MRLFIFVDHVMLTLGQKVLLHLGANCKLHLDDSERIMILILHTEQLTEYIMFTGLASSKLACTLQTTHLFKSSSSFEEYCACSTTTRREQSNMSGALEN